MQTPLHPGFLDFREVGCVFINKEIKGSSHSSMRISGCCGEDDPMREEKSEKQPQLEACVRAWSERNPVAQTL